MDKREHNDKRQIVDWTTVLSLVGETVWICLPRSVLYIVSKLLTRAEWRSTYVVEHFDNYYTIPNVSDMDGVLADIAEFYDSYGGVDQMNCDISQTLTDIATALQGLTSLGGSGCGCGSGGAGSTDVPPSSVDIPNPGVGDPPDGFESWEVFNQWKCDVAETIVANHYLDVSWFADANIYLLTALGLAGALITLFIPGGQILALLAVLTVIAGYDQTILDDAVDAIGDNYDELICTLYNAQNVTAAKDNYIQRVNQAIDATTTDTIARGLLHQTLAYLVSNDLFNKLFEYDEAFARDTYTGDCSGCDECSSQMILGTGSPETGGTMTAIQVGSHYELGWYVSTVRDMAITLSGWTASDVTSVNDFRAGTGRDNSCGDTLEWDLLDTDTNPFPTTINDCGRIFIVSATSFTANVSYS